MAVVVTSFVPSAGSVPTSQTLSLSTSITICNYYATASAAATVSAQAAAASADDSKAYIDAGISSITAIVASLGDVAYWTGGEFTGNVTTKAAGTGGSGLTLPHGVAPTTPANGDLWTTSAGLFARINGATVGPYETSGVSGSNNDAYWFGAGTDGNATITSGITTLTRDMYYADLTISGTGRLNPAGFRVFVSGVLDISAAPAGAISIAPVAGGNASAHTGGIAATGGVAGDICVTNTSTAGTTATASSGTQAAAPTVITGFGGNAGASGAGGPNTPEGTTGGVGRSASANTFKMLPRATFDIFFNYVAIGGGAPGAGGGSGGGDNGSIKGGGGGGGGAGNGNMAIYAKTINRSGSTAAGAIAVIGGAGGNGGNAQASGTGGGGGGGGAGGGGGYIQLVYRSLTGTTATTVVAATGGAGGNGGALFGLGSNGVGGSGGWGGVIIVSNVTTGAITVTVGIAGNAGSGTSGGAGGACAVSL